MKLKSFDDDPNVLRVLGDDVNPVIYSNYLRSMAGKKLVQVNLVRGYIRCYVNHGRWIVDCPFCKSAMLASFKYPFFLCPECGNEGNEGYLLSVLWPAYRQDIEEILSKREDIKTQNYNPEIDTIDILLKENEQHGITS